MTVRCVLAHDLINSITAIIALSELLADDLPEPVSRQRAANIRKLAERMAAALVTRQCDACAEAVSHRRGTEAAAIV